MVFTLFSSLHMNECVFLSFKARSMVWHKLQRKKIVYIAAVLIRNPWVPNYLLFLLKSTFPALTKQKSFSFFFFFGKATWHCITGKGTQQVTTSNLKAEAPPKTSCRSLCRSRSKHRAQSNCCTAPLTELRKGTDCTKKRSGFANSLFSQNEKKISLKFC